MDDYNKDGVKLEPIKEKYWSSMRKNLMLFGKKKGLSSKEDSLLVL